MADITRKEIDRRVKRRESLKEVDITGLNLKPTYSYWRLYKTGDVLKRRRII